MLFDQVGHIHLQLVILYGAEDPDGIKVEIDLLACSYHFLNGRAFLLPRQIGQLDVRVFSGNQILEPFVEAFN
ncbi:hypothetical protein D3C71_2146670 [compost metagenome]